MLGKIDKYQETIEKRNQKILKLQSDLENFKEYNFWAMKDVYGLEITAGDNITITTELSKMMSKILNDNKGKISVIINKNNISLIDEVIMKYSNFPFGYFSKYILLKSLGNPKWKIYAKKAESIFEITTSISQHHLAHDQALKAIKNDLKLNK